MADVQLTGSVTPGAASGAGTPAAVAPTSSAAGTAPGGTPATPPAYAPAEPAGSAAAGAQAAPGQPGDPNAKPPSDDEVKAAVKEANLVLSGINTQLVFVFDDQSHHDTVKLLDIQTQKVVQQIPSAAMPKTASALSGSQTSGTLVDAKA